ncbi:MAG: DNA alkylation repair protein [Bacteroidales bacterium]|nr:DNA alkylation repair protein [Bacteroidales bacterium]MCF8403874.1 DNA alkylation repair protein [Bacteroidales bacterium]
MTSTEILKELEGYGNESTKKVFRNHGAREPFYGVKVQDLKKILKKTKKNHELSLELYATGNSDAMYLAGLMADETKISKEDLNRWAKEAYWYYLSEYTVPWVAAESQFGFELALEWIESNEENIAAAGWSTLANLALLKPDEEIELKVFSTLLERVANSIHQSENRVRYTMNGFVIAVGSGIISLSKKAKEIAAKIGKVNVDVGGTACKVPLATDYIQKVHLKGNLGKKRKSARC